MLRPLSMIADSFATVCPWELVVPVLNVTTWSERVPPENGPFDLRIPLATASLCRRRLPYCEGRWPARHPQGPRHRLPGGPPPPPCPWSLGRTSWRACRSIQISSDSTKVPPGSRGFDHHRASQGGLPFRSRLQVLRRPEDLRTIRDQVGALFLLTDRRPSASVRPLTLWSFRWTALGTNSCILVTPPRCDCSPPGSRGQSRHRRLGSGSTPRRKRRSSSAWCGGPAPATGETW